MATYVKYNMTPAEEVAWMELARSRRLSEWAAVSKLQVQADPEYDRALLATVRQVEPAAVHAMNARRQAFEDATRKITSDQCVAMFEARAARAEAKDACADGKAAKRAAAFRISDPIAVQLPEALPCPPHHYVLDSPNGPVIPGRCKRCGDERLWDASPGEIQFAEALGMSYTWVTARLDAQDRAAIRRERFERMLGAWE